MSATAVMPPAGVEAPADPSDVKTAWQQLALALFIAVPFIALIVSVPVLWVWGLSWQDAVIAVAMYVITGHGITVGFHRYFTHRAFRARRWVEVSMAIAGSMAIQGPIVHWVADHRKHHRFSDRAGDPHSPVALRGNARGAHQGLLHSHLGWLFDGTRRRSSVTPPTCWRTGSSRGSRDTFPLWVALSILIPPLVGGLWPWSWQGAPDRVLLGQPGPGGRAAPRDLLDQLRVPHQGTPAVQDVGPQPERLVVGAAVHGRVVAQLPPRRSRLRRATASGDSRSIPARIVIRAMEHLRFVHDVRWPDSGLIAKRRLPVGT